MKCVKFLLLLFNWFIFYYKDSTTHLNLLVPVNINSYSETSMSNPGILDSSMGELESVGQRGQ